MAKVVLNPALERIQGKLGNYVYKFHHGEILAKMPDRTGIIATAEQEAQKQRFRLGVIYGKAVIADPQAKEIYEAIGDRKGEPAFAVAVGDFLTPPVVSEVDLSGYSGKTGETIKVRAVDDVEVTDVAVAIRSQAGTILEQGPAVWDATTAMWVYTSTTTLTQGQSVSIEVSATDRPGHKTTKSQTRN